MKFETHRIKEVRQMGTSLFYPQWRIACFLPWCDYCYCEMYDVVLPMCFTTLEAANNWLKNELNPPPALNEPEEFYHKFKP